MTPEEFEERVNKAISNQVARGFQLITGRTGNATCGCALTALVIDAGYEHLLLPDRNIGVVGETCLVLSGTDDPAYTSNFVRGFDHTAMLRAGGCDRLELRWFQAGQRVRDRCVLEGWLP